MAGVGSADVRASGGDDGSDDGVVPGDGDPPGAGVVVELPATALVAEPAGVVEETAGDGPPGTVDVQPASIMVSRTAASARFRRCALAVERPGVTAAGYGQDGPMVAPRTLALSLAGVFASSGVLHFAKPGPYRAMVPRSLPAPGFLVAASGVAELTCAGLLLFPVTRRTGGLASAALLVAVFPANVGMAVHSRRRPAWYQAMTWARLPLQIPMVQAALRTR